MKKSLILLLLLFLVACQSEEKVVRKTKQELLDEVMTYEKNNLEGEIFYNIFPISFADADQDGYGDLKGITEKLDYLKTIGVKGIWLNPIYPSPSYHKYDIVDYKAIDPQFGTMDDFQNLLEQAHKKEMVVILDMVFNHTAKAHPWFEKSMKNEKGYEDYYIKTNDLSSLKIGDKSAWYQYQDTYYYGSFWSEMPELNLESEKVRQELKSVLKFWLDLGVDGFRFDAAKHAYDVNEYETGTPLLEKNLQFWLEMHAYIHSLNPQAYTVAEVWLGNQQRAHYAPAFSALFNFDFGQNVVSSLSSANSSELLSPFLKGNKFFEEIPSYIDATFLTNHDQNRIGSIFQETPQRLKAAAAILLTMPGNPFIYYGEELGYLGVKPDEQIREPMRWSDDAMLMPTWEKLVLNQQTASVEQQLLDENSLLNVYKTLGVLRSQSDALRHGGFENIQVGNSKVLVFRRKTALESIVVMINLDSVRHVVSAELMGEVVASSDSVPGADDGYVLEPYGYLLIKE